MTLLEDINTYILTAPTDYFDENHLATAVSAKLADSDIHLGETRWGNLFGAVFQRRDSYVMVTEYRYSGDSEGDVELQAKSVEPREVTTTVWDTL